MRRTLLYIAVSFLLLCSGWQLHIWYHHRFERHESRRVKAQGNRLTSPLLDVELPEGMRVDYEPLSFKFKVKGLVQQQLEIGKAQKISVYYRDLHDGPWFGINEELEFDPASMMKIPVMIAWLKRAEKDPKVFRETFRYDGKNDLTAQQFIKPLDSIIPGKPYTVHELLQYMLNYSDNNATALLYNDLKPAELNSVLDGMDIVNIIRNGANSITVHGFSGFFRILYNASFLNREMSEKALQYLTLEDFPQGISAGVPQGTVVAAKFGESVRGDHAEIKQLHEFGIVYHPRGHYILGVMTEGRDFERQAEIIRDISRMVYVAVDSAASLKSDH